MGGAPFRGTWAVLMAFPFSSRSLAWGGPEAGGRKKFLLPVEWLKMNRKKINELREQARATVFFFETAPVFFPVLHSCWSITLPQLTPGRRIAASLPGERMPCRKNTVIFPVFASRPHLPG
ncbi:hypothetical protein CXT87_00855 [Akkermansia muciniphila]|nr:hypothetical protein CXT93_06660 [Akkermansia muciniphila]PND01698.1 hypothetical protein CXT87_00855 [Akkermansia muciniphila]PND04562.1 hypothetical protein CXT86_07425 [Akkermansia muciniphila]PND10122.1 hypothetical protein CXT85_04965 [Akkermansia muciniphila]